MPSKAEPSAGEGNETPTAGEDHSPAIGLLEYGEVPYGQALAQQYALRDGLAPDKFMPDDRAPVAPPDIPGAGDIAGYLLVVEHPPVVTLGKRSDTSHLLDRDRLRDHGIEIFEIDRGGEATFHNPGQLVMYPVLRLQDFGLGVVDVVRGLADAISGLCAEYDVRAGYDPDDPGVWTDPDGGEIRRKIASVGMRVQRGVSTHGTAINLVNDTAPFSWIRACGRRDAPMANLKSCIPEERRDAMDDDELSPMSAARRLYPAIAELTGADLIDVRVDLPPRDQWVEPIQ
jgi:lipoyl(octanoyl) transferase